jgi:hypothetical protein
MLFWRYQAEKTVNGRTNLLTINLTGFAFIRQLDFYMMSIPTSIIRP